MTIFIGPPTLRKHDASSMQSFQELLNVIGCDFFCGNKIFFCPTSGWSSIIIIKFHLINIIKGVFCQQISQNVSLLLQCQDISVNNFSTISRLKLAKRCWFRTSKSKNNESVMQQAVQVTNRSNARSIVLSVKRTQSVKIFAAKINWKLWTLECSSWSEMEGKKPYTLTRSRHASAICVMVWIRGKFAYLDLTGFSLCLS